MNLISPFNAREGHRPDNLSPVFLCAFFCRNMTKGFVKHLLIFSSAILILLITSGSIFAASGIYGDIQIVSQTDSELVFRYTVADTVWTINSRTGNKVLHIDGCENITDENNPPLPVKTIVLGIPGDSKPELQIINSIWSDEFPLEYSQFANYQSNIVNLNQQAVIRSQNTQSVNIFPLEYGDGSGRLLKEITVRVIFGRSGANSKAGFGYTSEGRFEKILSGLLLNYEQSLTWRRMKTDRISLYAEENIFSQSDNWIKIGFNTTGLYKLTYNDLNSAGINVAGIDPRTFRVFRGDGKPLPVAINATTAELSEMAVHVSGAEDGSFDSGDYVLLYSPGPDFYDYNMRQSQLEYVNNRYNPESYAFLTYGGGFSSDPLRMEAQNVTPHSMSTDVFSFRDKKHFEQDEFLSEYQGIIFDYYRWYYIDEASFDFHMFIDDLTGFELSKLSMAFAGRSPSIKIKGFGPDESNIYPDSAIFWSSAFSSGLNLLEITLDGNIRGDHLLDYMELEYQRRLQYRGGSFTFFGPSVPGPYLYHLIETDKDSTFTLCDVTDLHNQKLLTGFTQDESLNQLNFEYTHPGSGFLRFAISQDSEINTPSSLEPITIKNILEPGESHDAIVITPRAFISAFGAYKALREADGYNVYLAPIEDVYNYFAGGLTDPIAIRDFLKYAYENWPQPSPAFVLLGGDGCYDFLNNSGRSKPNYVPPFVVASDTSISDENFIVIDSDGFLDSDSSYPVDRGPDLVITRWPVRTATEVAEYISKLNNYQSSENAGRWQNLITYVADDEKKPGMIYLEREHTEQTEELAGLHTPDKFDKNKLYLIEYPLDSKGEKPQVKEKLIDAINDGTVLVNFIGHGNPHLWTDERIFRNEDIASLNNANKLSVIFTASCSIGEFDSPFEEGMAELLFRYTGGGAIATVAATRLVYSSPNSDYNNMTFDVMFSDEDYTFAEAIYISKFLRQMSFGISDNDRRFIMFGDPLLKIAFPRYEISFNSSEIDTLAALNLVTVEGEVRDDLNVIMSDFDGTVEVSVFDNQLEKTYRIYYGTSPYDIRYSIPGARIFRGKAEVQNGRFSLQFIVPKDISYGGHNARISAFAHGSSGGINASGSRDSIIVSGSIADITDTIAPEIKVYVDQNQLSDGDLIDQQSHLRIELYDSSGINLSGEVGHRFEISFNDDPFYTFDLTDDFIYNQGSYQAGEASLTLPEIENGNYVLKVKAWDSANNSTLKEYHISIGATEQAEIVELYNVPNPFVETTQFFYELSVEAENVNLEIFTLSGRKIHAIDNLPGRSGENLSATWDGKDKWGDDLSNGVYIYKLTVRTATQSADKNVEKFGKIVILR
jgi:Peptidase family C25